MNYLKKLAEQTAIYGLSSIIGRTVNYFVLTPLYTRVLSTEQYGIITDIYAYVAFLIILFTYGMETGFFRFSELETNKEKVYGTTLMSVLSTSILLVSLMVFFSQSLADWLKYPDHKEYVVLFAFIVGADAMTAIPFARLRQLNKARYFVTVKLVSIIVNIGLNLFFFVVCPWLLANDEFSFIHSFIHSFYDPQVHVGYVFISNLVSSLVIFIFLAPYMFKININFDFSLMSRMLPYCLPLLIAGLAGITNQHIDKILLKYLLPYENVSESLAQLGVYGACYKLSIIITLIVQSFTFAADPFYFTNAQKEDSKIIYAEVMKYFVIVISFVFLLIMMYLDFIKYFIGEDFHVGLNIVPVLLIANIFFGIYYNLSIWFKLSGKTHYGAYLSVGGAFVTLILNILLIPVIGYWGSTWATFVCFAAMMIGAYLLGKKHYPINYDLKIIIGYLCFAILLYAVNTYFRQVMNLKESLHVFLFNTMFVLVYLGFFGYFEKIKQKITTP